MEARSRTLIFLLPPFPEIPTIGVQCHRWSSEHSEKTSRPICSPSSSRSHPMQQLNMDFLLPEVESTTSASDWLSSLAMICVLHASRESLVRSVVKQTDIQTDSLPQLHGLRVFATCYSPGSSSAPHLLQDSNQPMPPSPFLAVAAKPEPRFDCAGQLE
jgi:hypothetical protein